MKYVITDETGLILREISCPESLITAQLQEGENAYSIAEPVDQVRDRVDTETGNLMKGVSEPPPRSYYELRLAEYPPIREQLDALWKGGAEAEAMRQKIMDIKARHPKDETDTSTP